MQIFISSNFVKKLFLSTLLTILALIFFYPINVDAKTVIKEYHYVGTNTVWTADAGPYIVEGYVNVGAKLTIQPGVIIKFKEKASIYVDGELLAAGTTEAPVIFTSFYDDATGGDDSPNSNKMPTPGIWGDIAVRGKGKLNIDNAIFKYGGTDPAWAGGLPAGVIFIWNTGTANITNTVFTQNLRALYNYWSKGNVIIHNSKIFNNSLGGVHSASMDIINLTDNWWGDDSGPYEQWLNPLGKGDKINSLYYKMVKFDPWIGKVTNKSPILSYSQEEKYKASSSLGVFPGKGDAGLTDFIFKIVYADADNDAPKNMSLVVQGEHVSSTYVMSVDNATGTATALRDGNFVNGEQYSFSMKFPKGKYKYYFTAADEKYTVRWPQTGELNFESGYSNIVFLPGLEASRLYKQGTLFENQLWEPNRNADVEKLFLDSEGKSLDQSIYTRDVIDEVNVTSLGQENIYKTFLESLDKMVADKTINEYKAMPYDWRMGIDEIVNGDVRTDVGTYSIIDELETLASTSQTGKVTIVAHSMGGIVAKRLIQRLTELGKQDLVDKLILVAVPQVGTPSSVAALLHGDGQELAGGLLLNRETARGLGENMKSAYALLPSNNYFTNAEKPIIVFDTLPTITMNGMISNYGAEINSSDILSQFLLAVDGRIKPKFNDTDSINVLSNPLLNESTNLHNSIDTWTPPAGLKVYQIAGWGLDTIAGIRYKEKQEINCPEYATDLRYCLTKTYYDREPIFSVNGDGTVMTSSAVAMGGEEIYYLDMKAYNDVNFVNRDHKNIAEIDNAQVFFNKIIKKDNLSVMPNYITAYRPDLDNSSLRISVHSPVSLNIFNSDGQHVGKIKNPNPDSDLEKIENQIPNSYYMEFGEGKYAGVGDNGEYQIDLKGLDYGTFTLDITEVDSGGEKTVSYKDIPVTPTTAAKLLIENLTSMSALEIDLNGDGKTDLNIEDSQDSIDPGQYIGMIHQYILNIDNNQHVRWELLNKLDVLSKFINKKEITNSGKGNNNRDEKKIEELLNSVEKHVIVISDKIIDKKQAKIILNMLYNLRNLLTK